MTSRIQITVFVLLVAFVAFPPIIRANQVLDPSRPMQRSGLPRSGELPRAALVIVADDTATVHTPDGAPPIRPIARAVPADDDIVQLTPLTDDGLGLRAPPLPAR
jgi:hypothetical protein